MIVINTLSFGDTIFAINSLHRLPPYKKGPGMEGVSPAGSRRSVYQMVVDRKALGRRLKLDCSIEQIYGKTSPLVEFFKYHKGKKDGCTSFGSSVVTPTP